MRITFTPTNEVWTKLQELEAKGYKRSAICNLAVACYDPGPDNDSDADSAELGLLRQLLDEVRRACTRDDDLPDGLLQRIDEALGGAAPAEAPSPPPEAPGPDLDLVTEVRRLPTDEGDWLYLLSDVCAVLGLSEQQVTAELDEEDQFMCGGQHGMHVGSVGLETARAIAKRHGYSTATLDRLIGE